MLTDRQKAKPVFFFFFFLYFRWCRLCARSKSPTSFNYNIFGATFSQGDEIIILKGIPQEWNQDVLWKRYDLQWVQATWYTKEIINCLIVKIRIAQLRTQLACLCTSLMIKIFCESSTKFHISTTKNTRKNSVGEQRSKPC